MRYVEIDDPSKRIFDAAPEPAGGYVRDLRAHVRAHGTPDTWRWHLHTKPPKGGPPPVLIAKNIDVPETLRAAVGLAPCPLCCLTAPKYFYGILTWWPEERALRVIGIECARKIFGEAFDREVIRFDRQQKASADLDFLIDALPMVAPMRSFVEEMVPIAGRLDWLRGRLLKGLSKTTAKALYKHALANKGLALFEERWVDTDAGRKRLPVSVARFPFVGFDVLSDWRQNPSALLDTGGRLLTGLGCENEDQIIDVVGPMGDDGMARARSAIVDAGRFFGTARERCASIQAFLSAETSTI